MINDEEDMVVCVRRMHDEDLSVREIRISSPDATGLGVDIMRVCLDFGLRILAADVSTDGTWCFLVLKVQLTGGTPPRWSLLKTRLEEICPNGSDTLRKLSTLRMMHKEQQPFLLQVSGYDRTGMLHALTHALWEADTTVVKAHITTTSAGEVEDSFWVYDNRDELPEAHRVLEINDRVKGALGPETMCTITAAPGGARPPDRAASGGLASRLPCKDATSAANLRTIVGRKKSMSCAALPDLDTPVEPPPAPVARTSPPLSSGAAAATADVGVDVDNTTSTSYTLITLHCRDRKGLLYDLFRALKEVDLRVAYGRVTVSAACNCEAELFVQDAEGTRISDPDLLRELTERLREAAALPVRIELRDAMDGAATELTVATSVEPGGRGRPRVTFDVTQGLSAAGVDVYTADVYVDGDLEDEDVEPASPSYRGAQEMHRFLLNLPDGGAVSSEQDKRTLLDVVQSCLLGTRPAGAAAPKWSGDPASGTAANAHRDRRPSQEGIVRTMSARWKGVV